jgi:hypothetical protein
MSWHLVATPTFVHWSTAPNLRMTAMVLQRRDRPREFSALSPLTARVAFARNLVVTSSAPQGCSWLPSRESRRPWRVVPSVRCTLLTPAANARTATPRRTRQVLRRPSARSSCRRPGAGKAVH